MFDERFARRRAARYRRKGLDATARRMVELLEHRGLRGATVLEIGGGVGEIHIELLRRGAASATNLELSPAYEAEAARLLDEAGLAGRVDRRLADIAADPAAARPADIVILHRVVCCYPDHPALLAAAARHARDQLVFSFPPRTPVSRAFVAVQNRLLGWGGRRFRTFAHPPAEMLAVLAEHGMHAAVAHRGAVWQVAHARR
ncbi:magnesium-protoporphyrin O-methyltransferase [Blastococcus sp. DSM 46786]|uniref:methyltransferase domain-containing protein n=1 Tax=Blastococcus sp. DSM 46786 TaxID=1798227 RepID=UPI0008D6A62C|nr:methyltransferase domain-containing protein [Blastococcus sp. DSM 46786]SEL54559.1 magnesium-protoporphyrin O-methyltransferase [Blastococcus sp. DSM 46786]